MTSYREHSSLSIIVAKVEFDSPKTLASRKTLLDMFVSERNEHGVLGSFFRACAAPELEDK